MRRAAILAVALALAAAPASAAPDRPHRPWGKTVTLAMPVSEAQSCIARELARFGEVLALPVDDGADIDFTMRGPFGANGAPPYLTIELRPVESGTQMKALYRHPLSQRSIDNTIAGVGKKCGFVVPAEADPVS